MMWSACHLLTKRANALRRNPVPNTTLMLRVQMHFCSKAGQGLMADLFPKTQAASLMHADAVLSTCVDVHISNPRGSIVVFLSCKPWRTECSCVTYVLHTRLTYNSEQNCTGPITTRMAARNQSHVSWRSIPRHFIRSFLAGTIPLMRLFKLWEFIDRTWVWKGKKKTLMLLTRSCSVEEHLSPGHYTTLHAIPCFVSFKTVCVG